MILFVVVFFFAIYILFPSPNPSVQSVLIISKRRLSSSTLNVVNIQVEDDIPLAKNTLDKTEWMKGSGKRHRRTPAVDFRSLSPSSSPSILVSSSSTSPTNEVSTPLPRMLLSPKTMDKMLKMAVYNRHRQSVLDQWRCQYEATLVALDTAEQWNVMTGTAMTPMAAAY